MESEKLHLILDERIVEDFELYYVPFKSIH